MTGANGFEEGAYVQLYTTGTLPSGLSTDKVYYVRPGGVDWMNSARHLAVR